MRIACLNSVFVLNPSASLPTSHSEMSALVAMPRPSIASPMRRMSVPFLAFSMSLIC